jgi:DNA-binding CsgD family transcriptional regulator/tetratricopeptide (TPR) repeat protein/tRNA A-37 threonylcarbamoyl transferase component Bud32
MAPEPDDLGARLQTALGSDYAVEGRLGSGGFAVVFLVRDVSLKRKLAVKVLSPEVISSHAMLDRFQREAETIAQLSHPHIVPLHFAGNKDNLVYLAMQAVDGGSLSDRLAKEKRLSIGEAARVFAEVASALAHAHKRGVIHRDIKPENVLMDGETGRSLVTDFGIAQTVGSASLTATGMVMGTPKYLSPEQVTGEPVDHRTDVYALGLMAYEMLAGAAPFSGPTPTAIMMKRLGGPPEPLRNVRPEIPQGLADLVNHCLEADPAQRLSDASEITRSLSAPVAAAGQARAARIRVQGIWDAPSKQARSTLSIPHVGRSGELGVFRDWLASAAKGNGGVQLVAGTSGIGKTRLVSTVAAAAERDGWQVGTGRVYAVETGVPYGVWSDAVTGLVRDLDAEARRILTRGGNWLGTICPAFASSAAPDDAEAPDGKAKLLWNFAQFVSRMGEKRPLLLVLENLHLADSASLELLHFVARQVTKQRVAIIATYTESELEQQPALRDAEQSLLAIGAAKLMRLDALTQADTEQLVCETFGVDHPAARQLARRVFSWTRGHPFFVEEALKTIVERGRISQKEGRWVGWELEELDLPRTVRLAVSQRLDGLSTDAHAAAAVAAVIGARVRMPVLREASDLNTDAAVAALEELERAGILVPTPGSVGSDAGHEFAHPIIQDVIYDALGSARTRQLHSRVARALEATLGDQKLVNADRLAFHYLRADPELAGEKTATYLAAAGRDALLRHADKTAADYLFAALERSTNENDAGALIEDLAQARQRLGDYAGAMKLWEQTRAKAVLSGDVKKRGRVERRMGLAAYWGGRFEDALTRFNAALESAEETGDEAMRALLLINRGTCWQSMGKPADAERDLGDALAIAQKRNDDALLTRAHRALLMLHVFVGPPETARAHGEQSLAAAERVGDKTAQWSAHVGLATLFGLTGDGGGAMRHVALAEPLCDELQSPLFRAYTDEITMQWLFASGDWDAGIAVAERTIAVARALNQRTLLPRVLVWATHFYIARGEYEYSKRLLDEAWEVGVARSAKGQPIEVHSQIAVYAGLAAYYNVLTEYDKAVEIGEQGLAIADRVGYNVWAIYRLIPVTLEAAFSREDGPRAQRLLERLASDSERMKHRLGLVWVDASRGLMARYLKDWPTAISLMKSAITGLETVPWVYDAARLRRWLGDTLIRSGDREAGIRELKRCHEVSADLGALVEVDRARVMMRNAGVRPPTKAGGKRARLTIRESDIARLVLERKSNKEIGAKLGIATRTVTTHVANIFAKLGVSSRADLAARLRDTTVGGEGESVAGVELS